MSDHDRRLAGFLADELKGTELLAFEAHLDTCSECLDAVRLDEVGRQLVASLRMPLEPAMIARLEEQLGRVRSPSRGWGRTAMLTAAASILLIAVGLAWFVRRDPHLAATPASVVEQMLGDDALSPSRSPSTMQTVTAGGVPVVIANSANRLAMPTDSTAMSFQSSDVWLVTRSGINVLCINGSRPVLIASTLDADRLLAIAIQRNLL
jgi:anti-sigma factor RsiW